MKNENQKKIARKGAKDAKVIMGKRFNSRRRREGAKNAKGKRMSVLVARKGAKGAKIIM